MSDNSAGTIFSAVQIVVGAILTATGFGSPLGTMMIAGGVLGFAGQVVAQSMKTSEQEYDLSSSTASTTASSATTSTVNGVLLNTESTDECLPLIYGAARVGINRIYRITNSDDNEYCHIVGTIAEGEIEGVLQVDDVDQIWFGDTLISDPMYSGLVTYEVYKGTGSQNVCPSLQSADPSWNDALRHTAYIYIKLKYDSDVFTSLPRITLLVKGLKVYNPSTGLTAYSDNPALCARDFITRSSRRGGMGINASRLDDDSFTAAAAYCTAKGWTCGLPITEYQAAADNLAQILSCFRGALIYSGNEYKLKYRDLNYETSVMDVDEHDVICFEGGNSSLSIHQPSIFDTPNGICIKFLDAELNYQSNEYIHADNDAILSDGGDYREETITIKGINSLANAMRMAFYHLERFRYNKTVDFGGHPRLLALEPLDIINLTHSKPGWEDKQLRVVTIALDQNLNVQLSLIEEDIDFYDDTYDVSEHTAPDTNIISPNTRPPAVSGVTLTEQVYSFRERSFTRLLVSFTPPAASTYPYWMAADVWVKIGSGDYKYMTRVRDSYIIDPVNEGETYYIKLVSVNIWDVKQLISAASEYSRTIEGKTTQPSNLSALTAIASGDTVILQATRVSDSDVEGYEARLGSVWVGGILFGYNKEPILSKSGVRPGTHTFVMSPKSNNGLYSASPPSASCEVFYPSGYSDKNSWSWDFSTGTHDNTEQTTYSTYNCLKCSHTSGVLTGKWTSPEYDLGSVKTVRVWGDFLTTFISAGNTWGAIFPSGTTWNDKAPAVTKWQELMAVETQAVVLQAKIKWGNTSGSLTNEADFFEILAPEFTARYIQVEVTIVDNAAGSNLYLKTLNMKAAYWT